MSHLVLLGEGNGLGIQEITYIVAHRRWEHVLFIGESGTVLPLGIPLMPAPACFTKPFPGP